MALFASFGFGAHVKDISSDATTVPEPSLMSTWIVPGGTAVNMKS